LPSLAYRARWKSPLFDGVEDDDADDLDLTEEELEERREKNDGRLEEDMFCWWASGFGLGW